MRSLAIRLAVTAAAIFAAAVPAHADVGHADIASAGPLTHVFVGTDLSCQVAYRGDRAYELYPPDSELGDCGTFLAVGAIAAAAVGDRFVAWYFGLY